MSRRKELRAVLLLVFLVLIVFWKAVLGGIFYFGDIFQRYYPMRAAYARELTRLSLPLWTPDVMAGYPLLAEGELGALYPPNLILHTLLPVPLALNVFILGHLVLAAVATYSFARRLRVGRGAALCSGLVYALSGFMVAHLNHVTIVACAAWLPLAFLLTDRTITGDIPSRRLRDAVLLALVIGLEFLAGHPQIAVLTVLAIGAYAAYLAWLHRPQRGTLVLFVVSLLLGAGVAAAQLVPSYELTQLSERAGGLDAEFFTSFSLHPLYLVHLLSPFVLGNPYPSVSVELVGYVGWLPLLLAVLAPFVVRKLPDRALRPVQRIGFFCALGIVSLLLALGRWNPVYAILLRLPVFNLFRVPARYLYLFAFSVAMLAGLGLDALSLRARGRAKVAGGGYGWPVLVGVALMAVLGASRVASVDDWVDVWRSLPVVLGACSVGLLIWAWRGKLSYSVLTTLALALVIGDLVAFNAVYNRTYNETMPLQEFVAPPRSLSFFRSQPGVYRLHTYEEIIPVLSVMRESYYPNLSLIHGLSASNGLFPLVPTRYARYVEQMTSRMLDLLGVKYFLIPQVLPVDAASESYDVEDPFTLNAVGRNVSIPPTQAVMVDVESYLSHSVDWPDGQAVAEIHLYGPKDDRETIVLRAGWHTADWAYSRSDVRASVRHQQAPVARSWPARSGFPPEEHAGCVYRAQFRLATALTVTAVEVRPLVPDAYVRIERLTLVDESGARHQLSHLLHMGDHTLAYRSEDVVVYANHDVLPRAFVVHSAQAVEDDTEALAILQDPAFDPSASVLLATTQVPVDGLPAQGADRAELLIYDTHRVVVEVETTTDGYLVLTDAWYPGWHASVDGQEEPILRANVLFRAVGLSPGQHTVEFTYVPRSFTIGLWVSAAALLLLVGLWSWSAWGKMRSF